MEEKKSCHLSMKSRVIVIIAGALVLATVMLAVFLRPWSPSGPGGVGVVGEGPRAATGKGAPSPDGAGKGGVGGVTGGRAGGTSAGGPAGGTAQPKEKYIPPEVKDPRVADFVNRESKNPRVTPDIASRIPIVENPEDVKAVTRVLMDPEDDDTVRHEAANLLRRSGYKDLTLDLERVLENPREKERFRGWAIQHLFLNYRTADKGEQQRIVDLLKKYVKDRDTSVQRESVLALHRLEDPLGLAVALTWLHAEKDTGVRDLAIRVIREEDIRAETPTIRKYLHDEDPVIRIAAIVTLSEWGDTESIPAFEEAAKSGVVRIQRAGELALKRVHDPRPPRLEQPGPIR